LLSGYRGIKQREATVPIAAKAFIKEDGERVGQLYKSCGKPGQSFRMENPTIVITAEFHLSVRQ
jgi:hypothetical protein